MLELSATSPNNHDNPVTVVKLAANFDKKRFGGKQVVSESGKE